MSRPKFADDRKGFTTVCCLSALNQKVQRLDLRMMVKHNCLGLHHATGVSNIRIYLVSIGTVVAEW